MISLTPAVASTAHPPSLAENQPAATQARSPFSADRATQRDADERKFASQLQMGASVLSSDDAAQAGKRMLRSTLNSEVNDKVQQWVNQFGTARVQVNVDDDFSLEGSAFDVLLPLYDARSVMAFTQLGARHKNSRKTVNVGAGVRLFQTRWMYGINTFFDNDLSGKNRRMAVGAEVWTDYVKLAMNSYWGMTEWHQSRDFDDYDERPANGYDVRTDVYLPMYPQLGVTLMYEQYRGEDVALFGRNGTRQKDPQAMTMGMNYTPIPLLTLGAEHRAGSGNQTENALNLQLSYRLGESLQSHTDPSAVAATRTLAGSRHDLVERNNQIVLDQQKQVLMRLQLPETLQGKEGETARLMATVSSKYGVDHLLWNYGSFVAAGGKVSEVSRDVLELTYPPFMSSGNNTYNISAIAYDARGNGSNSSSTQVSVLEAEAGGNLPNIPHLPSSSSEAVPDTLMVDGTSTAQLIIYLRNGNNQPLSGLSRHLTLPFIFTAHDNALLGRRTALLAPVEIGEVSEFSPGEYRAELRAGSQTGTVVVSPRVRGIALDPLTIALVTSGVDAGASLMTAEPTSILSDGVEHSTLTFTARDSNNNPVRGLPVTFTVSGVTGYTVSEVTENSGVYSATLIGRGAGSAIVVPQVTGNAISGLSATVELITNVTTLEMDVSSGKAKVGEMIPVTITALTRNGEPVAGADITVRVGARVDRQQQSRTEGGMSINGEVVQAKVFTTDSSGKVNLQVSEPNGIGLKTTLAAISGRIATSGDVIFTVLTSPDTDRAQMYGHMSDAPIVGQDGTTFVRPKVVGEYSAYQGFYVEANERWALHGADSGGMYAYCGSADNIPSRENYISLFAQHGGSIPNVYGWPKGRVYRSEQLIIGTGQRRAYDISTSSESQHTSGVLLLVSCKR